MMMRGAASGWALRSAAYLRLIRDLNRSDLRSSALAPSNKSVKSVYKFTGKVPSKLPQNISWRSFVNRLLSPSVFPVGFSNGAATRKSTVVAWRQEVDRALETSEPALNHLCFRLLDRLFAESKNGTVSAAPISAYWLNWILSGWMKQSK